MLECSLPQDLKIPCHKTKNVTLVSSVVDMALIPGGSLISKIFIVTVLTTLLVARQESSCPY